MQGGRRAGAAGEEMVDDGQGETAAVDPRLGGGQLQMRRSILCSSFPPVLQLRGLRRGS